MEETILKILPAAATGILSGLGDSYGFVHATRIWDNGKFNGQELMQSAAGFAFGIGLYWVSVKFLGELGIKSPTVQTLSWFGATVIGLSVLSGEFWRWSAMDKAVGLGVIAGLAWLMSRSG
ncbi:hypothetical protein HYS82_03445 [Candidatus Amesbacteria bacterium]|nr:hypothetical protein [Candidatus Amesbacteria bacterium]